MANENIEISSSQRLLWIDVLNIMACIGVVALHSTTERYTGHATMSWLWTEFVHVAISWPVPVFFMISGCNLLSPGMGGVKMYAQKRFYKTVIPFVVWSVLYMFFDLYVQDWTFTKRELLENFLMGRFNPNMWFFLPLFGLYMIFPLLWDFCKTLSGRKILYLFCIILTFAYILPYSFRIFRLDMLADEWYLNFSSLSGNVCLAVLGWWIGHNDVPRKLRPWLYAAAIILLLFTFAITVCSTLWGERIDNGRSPMRLLLPIAVFTFVRYTRWDAILSFIHVNKEYVGQIASLSYGVYLIHYAVLVVAEMYHLHFYNVYVGFIPTYITSLAIAMLIKKTPYVCKILP